MSRVKALSATQLSGEPWPTKRAGMRSGACLCEVAVIPQRFPRGRFSHPCGVLYGITIVSSRPGPTAISFTSVRVNSLMNVT